MTFRITREEGEGKARVRIDGRLGAEGLGELRRACAGAPAGLRIELGELRSADESVLDEATTLAAGGAELVGASQYLELLLAYRRQVSGGP